MKKLSVHLIIFFTVFLPISNTQAADVELFDFDDYDGRIASMAEADRVDEEKINGLLAPLDVPLGNRGNLYNALGDDDATLQEILAESVRTEQIEQERREQQIQRGVNAAGEEKSAAQDKPIAAIQAAEWEPSSMDLIHAGELMMELRRDNNDITPTREKMVKHLASKMGISDNKAKKILEELLD